MLNKEKSQIESYADKGMAPALDSTGAKTTERNGNAQMRWRCANMYKNCCAVQGSDIHIKRALTDPLRWLGNKDQA